MYCLGLNTVRALQKKLLSLNSGLYLIRVGKRFQGYILKFKMRVLVVNIMNIQVL